MTIRLTLDRFEGRDKQIAVLVTDDGRTAVVPRDLLPSGTRGGEVLLVTLIPAEDAGPAGPGEPVVDINAAPAADLRTLPGVGPVLAERMIAGRPYADFNDLARVEGLGKAKLEQLRPHLAAAPATEGVQASPAAIRLRVKQATDEPDGDVRLVTEDGSQVILPGDLLPGPTGVGESLTLTIERDPEATRQVAEETRSIQDQLRGRDPGGDLKL